MLKLAKLDEPGLCSNLMVAYKRVCGDPARDQKNPRNQHEERTPWTNEILGWDDAQNINGIAALSFRSAGRQLRVRGVRGLRSGTDFA